MIDRRLGPFLAVGTIGFIINLGVTSELRRFYGIMLGGSIGFLLASTTTFFLNRAITFSASRRPGQKGWIREWLKYLVVNLVGGLGDVACLDIGSRMSSSEVSLVLLVLFGSAVTAGINFILSKQFVFARA